MSEYKKNLMEQVREAVTELYSGCMVGDRDIDRGGFSVGSRGHGDLGTMTLETLCEHIREDIDQGKPKYIVTEY